MKSPAPHKSTTDPGWNFDNSYIQLPGCLYARRDPTPVRAPRLAVFNQSLAKRLGLDPNFLTGDEGAALFSGFRLPQAVPTRPSAEPDRSPVNFRREQAFLSPGLTGSSAKRFAAFSQFSRDPNKQETSS